jgi:hypothetical protein
VNPNQVLWIFTDDPLWFLLFLTLAGRGRHARAMRWFLALVVGVAIGVICGCRVAGRREKGVGEIG